MQPYEVLMRVYASSMRLIALAIALLIAGCLILPFTTIGRAFCLCALVVMSPDTSWEENRLAKTSEVRRVVDRTERKGSVCIHEWSHVHFPV